MIEAEHHCFCIMQLVATFTIATSLLSAAVAISRQKAWSCVLQMMQAKQVLFSIMSFENGGEFGMLQDDVVAASADTSFGLRLAAMHQLGLDPKVALM